MKKYSVMFECDYKGNQEAAAAAAEIAKESAGIAPNIYMLLCCYADKMMLEYDKASYGTSLIDFGINVLQDLGYIERGSGSEEDDYSVIWILK